MASPVAERWAMTAALVIALTPLTPINWFTDICVRGDLTWHLAEVTLHSLAMATLVAWLVAWACRWRRVRLWLAPLALTIAITLMAVVLFLALRFGTTITPQTVLIAAETNSRETSEFLHSYALSRGSLTAIASALLLAVLTVVAMRRGERITRWLSTSWRPAAIALIVVPLMALGIVDVVKYATAWRTLPGMERCSPTGNDVVSTTTYSLLSLSRLSDELSDAIDVSLAPTVQATTDPSVSDSLKIVLVIGESFNKRHSSLYGYRLDTSPKMCAERDSGHLVVFEDAVAPYNLTSLVLRDLFSCNHQADGEAWSQWPMFTSVFHNAGWRVHLWDNQRDYADEHLFTVSVNALLFAPKLVSDIYESVNDSTAEQDLPFVDYFNSHCPWRGSSRDLVVLHLMGQHVEYDCRYPDERQWRAFGVDDYSWRTEPWLDRRRRQLIADYDNATRYNDCVLAHILDICRDQEAVVVMLADHGEQVMDYRDFYERDHTAEKTAQMVHCENDIPLLVWCSPAFCRKHPDALPRIAAASRRPVMEGDVCQMLMYLAGLKTPLYRPEHDPLSDSYVVGRRLIYDTIDYDALIRK